MNDKQPLEIKDKRVEYENIIYLINDEENTACIVGSKKNLKKIIIPLLINYESKEYYVTSILERAFEKSKIQFVKFASDSKVQTIEKYAFYDSKIKSITIPSSVTFFGENAFYQCDKLKQIEIPNDSKLQTICSCSFCYTNIKSFLIPSELIELKEEWCYGLQKLSKISVSPKNPRYCCFDEKMIIGKTKIDQNNYDCLVFCVRNIKKIKIPNFIEHICSCAFNYCQQLEEIIIENDSKLKTIDKCAFSNSSIKSIRIPSSVTFIGENAFSACNNFQVLEIPNDSKITTISNEAFNSSYIESLSIPSKLVDLKEGWCYCTSNLTKITVSAQNPRYCFYEDKMIIGKTNIYQDNYDCIVFCVRNIKKIKIPNFIEHICSYSFLDCDQLKEIVFENDSKLQTINKYAFAHTLIKKITIPSSVVLIGECAIAHCNQIESIEFSNDSKLQKIQCLAFFLSTIKSIAIPSSVTIIEQNAFACCMELKIVEINIIGMKSFYKKLFKDCQDSLLLIPNNFLKEE